MSNIKLSMEDIVELINKWGYKEFPDLAKLRGHKVRVDFNANQEEMWIEIVDQGPAEVKVSQTAELSGEESRE